MLTGNPLADLIFLLGTAVLIYSALSLMMLYAGVNESETTFEEETSDTVDEDPWLP